MRDREGVVGWWGQRQRELGSCLSQGYYCDKCYDQKLLGEERVCFTFQLVSPQVPRVILKEITLSPLSL